jgi:hypothetical protein
MKTFEEKFTAWVDGELKGEELTSFETELAGVEDAELDRVVTRQLGDLLRDHGQAPGLQNADFFNHQIMERIHAEMPVPVRKPERRQFGWFSLPRLALAGACAAAAVFAVIHYTTPSPAANGGNQVAAEIIRTNSTDPNITATAFYSQKNDATVLWLDWKNQPAAKHTPEKHGEKAGK